MKKLLAIILAITFIFSCFSVVGVTVSAAVNDVQDLQNTYHRLTEDKELTIGYIGGSVTAGTGASAANSTSWRALTTSWFKSQFPDATITEKNMAIGGHGTIFALYRMERALLQLDGDLDLVFIETAVNDNYDDVSGDTLRRYMESIINKIYAKNPNCNIVMVITGNVSTMSAAHKTGVAFRPEHRDVAAHYGIPVIDAGAALYNKIYAENGKSEVTSESNSVWKKYFSDSVHPLDAGYKVYADEIKSHLTAELVDKNLDSSKYAAVEKPAANLMSGLILDAYDVDFTSFPFNTATSFSTSTYSPSNNAISYKKLMSDNEGETFTVKFNGTSFGFWSWSYNVKTNISYSVDGGAKKTKEIYRSSSNHKAYILVDGLAPGEHTITITHEDSAKTFELYSMFIAGTSATVTSAGYNVPADDTVAKEGYKDAIYIGKTGTNRMSNVFVPLSARNTKLDGSGEALTGDTHFKVTFNAKMISGTKPILGFVRTVYGSESPGDGSVPEMYYVNNGADTKTGAFYEALYTKYDAQTGKFEAVFGATVSDNYYKTPGKGDKGGRWGYLTIGNAEHNGDWHSEYDYDNAFIMSDIEIKVYDPKTKETKGDNLAPSFSEKNVDFDGTYFVRKKNDDSWDNFYYAGANKWHIDTAGENIKRITVPEDYLDIDTKKNETIANNKYAANNFVKVAETDYTREYYTNANYSNMYFEKLGDTDGFAVVEDINKKVIVIDANHEGEADDRVKDGIRPQLNRKANIFVPISLAQYNLSVAKEAASTQFIVKVSFKAKILEGDGYPVLGRIVMHKSKIAGDGTGTGSYAEGKMSKNIHLGGYHASTSHENYYDTNGKLLSYSYNPETEEFVGYIRMKAGDSSYASVWGTTEILTIGNAENVYGESTYDTTEFNSSFAISDVKVDAYIAESYNSGYKMKTLAGEDIAPDFYAENIDTTTTWQYRYVSKKDSSNKEAGCSSHAKDVGRASQKTWSVEGAVGLVHSHNLTECFDKHTLTHKEATDTTREYYACSCGKNYKDAYATVEIDDISAKKQMLVINSAGEKTAQVFIPMHLTGFKGNAQFKFTAKLKIIGEQVEPTMNLFIARNFGEVGGATADGDCKVISQSYNKETNEFTAIVQVWRPSNYSTPKDRPHYCYEEPNTGANVAIVLGNFKHDGNGGVNNAPFTTYAIADTEFYRIKSSTDTTLVDGVNLMSDITDKTVVLNNNYALLDYGAVSTASNAYSNTNTPLAAPLNTWGMYGTGREKIAVTDIPAGFFDGEKADDQMLAIYGSGNQHALTYETYLEPGELYRFDIDYKTFGGVKRLINPQIATGSSYYTLTEDSDEVVFIEDTGSHYSVTFYAPDNARKSFSGNFKLYLGQTYPAKTSGSVYFANASLCKAIDESFAENLILNGDFNYGNGEALTEANYSEALPFWNKDDILNYAQAQTVAIPEDFFTADTKDTKDMALLFKGGNWNELQFFAELEPNTTYELSYNYRTNSDIPELIQRGGTGSIEITDMGNTANGEYLQTYKIVTSSDKNNGGAIGNANTRFAFKLGRNSYDKEFYIANIKLYKVVDGERDGNNIIGNLNPILDDSEGEVQLAQDVASAMRRSIARGWLGGTQDKGGAVSASVVKVADDFFTFIPYAERMTVIRKDLIDAITGDLDNMDYDANDDGEIDLKDLVKIKKLAAGVVGADTQANILYNKIMNAPNTEATGTVYYVSNDGNDSNAGTSASAPLATITKANSKVKSGDTVLLKRGDTWRAVANAETSYEAKAGVTYGAYGEGDKPLILGSSKNYATASWTNVSGNIWKTQISNDAHDANRIGNIYFFNGANDEEPTVIGRVVRDGKRFASYNDLTTEGDVYSDISDSWFGNDKGTVYVYSVGNPATKYGRIEIAEKREVLLVKDGATVDNIAIKFAGGHAINGTGVKDVTITNCEIGYVGGAPLNAEVYGNGIQFGLGAENITVKNNYVYQCLDAGITFQSWGDTETTFDNIYFTDNLLTNNYYNIEFFTTGDPDHKSTGTAGQANGIMKNIYITGNVMRFAGDCWSYTQRMDSTDGKGAYRCANICVTQDAYYEFTTNLNIMNNIFDITKSSHVYWTWDGVTAGADKTTHPGLNVEGNTFYQRAGAEDDRAMYFGNTSSYSVATSKQGLADAVAVFDKNPALVEWIANSPF